jgi:pimeloyl-ACP methyl ester carboxylesterase
MSMTDTISRSEPGHSTADIGSQLTAENRSVQVGGDTFVYRRFGNAQTSPPVLCLQHFRGNLDFWDPILVDRIARDREVILLANRGVGASTGAVPDNVTDMARDVILFARAVGLEQVDLLGFSLGGHISQELALLKPRMVRRIVLAGTGPQGGPGLHRWSDDVYTHACADEINTETALNVFFSGSEESRAKGMAYLGRTQMRKVDRDEPTDLATRDAQFAALTAWGIPDASKLDRLAGITQPVFVAIGDNDTMMPVRNSRLLADLLPNAHLRIYPDANHGFLNQYPELFGDHVKAFLNAV